MAGPISLDEWRLRQGLTHKQLGQLIGCAGHMAYIYCCDPSDQNFRLPRSDRMARIYLVTNGEVRPDSFYRLPRISRPFDPSAPELPLEAAA